MNSAGDGGRLHITLHSTAVGGWLNVGVRVGLGVRVRVGVARQGTARACGWMDAFLPRSVYRYLLKYLT